MATTKKSAHRSTTKAAGRKSSGTKSASTKSSTKSSSKKSSSQGASSSHASKSSTRATKSPNTKTAARRRHITGADTHKTPGSKSAQAKPKGEKPSTAQACWPGYEPTPGKKAGQKGSCRPKKHQTSAQRKGDQKAYAAAHLSGQR